MSVSGRHSTNGSIHETQSFQGIATDRVSLSSNGHDRRSLNGSAYDNSAYRQAYPGENKGSRHNYPDEPPVYVTPGGFPSRQEQPHMRTLEVPGGETFKSPLPVVREHS
jgi:hypothetical protein